MFKCFVGWTFLKGKEEPTNLLEEKYKKFIREKLDEHPVQLSADDMDNVFVIFESYLKICIPRVGGGISTVQIRAVADTVLFSVTNVLNLLHKEEEVST